MMILRILTVLVVTAFMAHAQPADSTNAVPPALESLLQTSNVSRPTNEKATIYSTVAVPPLKTMLQALAPTAKTTGGSTGDATHFTCEWPDVSVRFTIKTNWNSSVETAGMRQWLSRHSVSEQTTAASQILIHQMGSNVDCVGVVITPKFDAGGKASALVFGLATRLDGYVFAQQSFYDATGAKIIGDTNAPAKLQQ